jgi:hypothetical protein
MTRFFFVSSWRLIGGALLFPLSWAALAACSGDDVTASSEPVDSGTPDAVEAAAHAADASDGGSDAGTDADAEAGVPPVIDSFGDVSRWRRFDPAAAFKEPFMSSGAAFDGTYVYVASGRGDSYTAYSKILRHDPRKAFDDPSSWSTFDPASLSLDMVAGNALFDGRFVYFAARTQLNNSVSRVVLRYDTTAGGPFEAPSSWSSIDVTSLTPRTYYGNSVLANGFMYLVPYVGDPALVRYDLSKEFTDVASWQKVDLKALNPVLFTYGIFSAAVFDGRYLHFIPGTNASTVARYDTTLPLDSAASWEGFDTTALQLQARSFRGATFDGRYIYYAPNNDQTQFKISSSFLRYDTTGVLSDYDSWAVMPVSQVSTIQAYSNGTFDGRYVYFAPGAANPTALRVDTQGAFTDPASWQSFALTSLDTTARSYTGATFDGTHVYFTPNYLAIGSKVTAPLLRFQAIVDRDSP